MSENLIYFAYGSNMLSSKLREVAPSARPLGRASLKGYRLVMNKKSIDGSCKANLEEKADGLVWGVLFALEAGELERLDRSEGGYHRKPIEVKAEERGPVKAVAYVSSKLTSARPYDWYLRFIIEGAREHNLPAEYTALLEQIPTQPDERAL
jgi:gamma-glutamylcyclotransferase (GGCT)/AIG2-like uncharacterized protein YtfP